jgi:hypothetical protein
MILRGSRALTGLCVMVALLASCDGGDDDEGAAKPDETTTTSTVAAASSTTTTAAGPGATAPCTNFPESSPAQFDAKGGRYAVYLTKLDVGKRIVGFDVIQFLGGEAAAQAYKKDNPGTTDGPPNDYYVVNESKTVREASVGQSVEIVILGDDPAEQKEVTLAEVPAHLAKSTPSEPGMQLSTYPYWLTVADGTVNEICQQYVP